MIPPLEKRYQRLEERKRTMLERLDALSAEQLDYRKTPGSWSPLQVGEHVLSAEIRSVDVLLKQGDRPSARRTLRQKVLHVLVGLILKLGVRVKNPTGVDPQGRIES